MEGLDKQVCDRYYVGIDIGSVSLNCIVIDQKKEILYESPYCRHFGRVEEELVRILGIVYRTFEQDNISAVAFTGNHGQKISDMVGGFYEFETICQVRGSIAIVPDVRTIISMGGQDTALFQINHNKSEWELDYFNTNGPCASGTGSFIDQQAQRLSTSLYNKEVDLSQDQIDRILRDFIKLGLTSKNSANVACRCTVFTKSDMIHLQNKGESLEDIIYGLHIGNARNYVSTIVSNRLLENPIIFIGGLSMNELQVRAFKGYFQELVVPEHNSSVGALGVALHALETGMENRPEVNFNNRHSNEDFSLSKAPRLELIHTDFLENSPSQLKLSEKGNSYYLGIDVGSTTTKYALIDEDRRIVLKDYVHTQGKPVEVVQRLLRGIQLGTESNIEIEGVATTGSGRNVIGDFLNADLIIDEITAHARGAVEIDPQVDTIFEIGGQDSKYISLINAYPLDFDMNKVCAAGTGSFLHELANKYGINIVGEFQEIALSSETPVKLAERCTVFMESDLVSYHQKGAHRDDLMAGLCYAIVSNYLNRVVGNRKIGEKIMFLGGPSLNKGVVAAFEQILGRGMSVPNNREVLGAFGAAISVQEKMAIGDRVGSNFRGLERTTADCMDLQEKTCKADANCHNQCKLKIYDFDGRKSVWGGECGRYELIRSQGTVQQNFFQLRETMWQTYMSGICEILGDEDLMESEGRPTIGMQMSLYTLQTGVLWAHFFDHLGYRLVLSPCTNSRISAQGIETITAETCYPIKISHGHVRELAGKTRFLFLPAIVDMSTPERSERGFFCPLVQSNQYMVRMAIDIDPDTCINPVIHMKYDHHMLALELGEQMSEKLGRSISEIREALKYGLERQNSFVKGMYQKGREILEAHNQDLPLVVVTGRSYNLYDEKLNLRLGQNLAKIGVKALPMDFIDVSDVGLQDFSYMYWGMGAQILRTAKLVRRMRNYYGIHITNFGCGADSFIEHFYKYIMGDKPYLILELDEHSAVAGMMTRLEAFKNVIENCSQKQNLKMEEMLKISN